MCNTRYVLENASYFFRRSFSSVEISMIFFMELYFLTIATLLLTLTTTKSQQWHSLPPSVSNSCKC